MIVLSIQTYLVALQQSVAEKRARVCRNAHCWTPPPITLYIWLWRHGDGATSRQPLTSPTSLHVGLWRKAKAWALRGLPQQSLCGETVLLRSLGLHTVLFRTIYHQLSLQKLDKTAGNERYPFCFRMLRKRSNCLLVKQIITNAASMCKKSCLPHGSRSPTQLTS